jgi:hypothetical protein
MMIFYAEILAFHNLPFYLFSIHENVAMIVTWHYPKTSECLDRFVVEYLTVCPSNDKLKRCMHYKVRYFIVLQSGIL